MLLYFLRNDFKLYRQYLKNFPSYIIEISLNFACEVHDLMKKLHDLKRKLHVQYKISTWLK